MTVVFALILPIISFMYIDILETKKETKRQQEQVQRLLNQVKKEKEDKWFQLLHPSSVVLPKTG